MFDIVQIVGALVVLAAFLLTQMRVLDPRSPGYLWPNLIGAVALGVDAYLAGAWGFVILEVSWGLVAAWSLATRRTSVVAEAVESAG